MTRNFRVPAATALALCALALPAPAYAQPLMGQIFLMITQRCPKGSAEAAGQTLPILQNQALFALLGVKYGGDGRTNFKLPDLRGRVPIGMGQGDGLANYTIGQTGGAEQAIVTQDNLPSHTHNVTAYATSAAPNVNDPKGAALAAFPPIVKIYSKTVPTAPMAAGTVVAQVTGNTQMLRTRSPFLGIRYCIAITGLFPSRG
jgi:microcystin-dependent protein